ncbi:MAG: peroxiredoxin family protein [Verrucomicrobiales bacterium]
MTRLILLFSLLGCALLSAGSANEARRIQRDYDLAHQAWLAAIQQAADPAAQARAWAQRPDPNETGRALWNEIKANLSESWTIEPAVWILANAPDIAFPVAQPGEPPVAVQPASVIRRAVEKFHTLSPKVGPYCIGITLGNDPKAFALLELIEAKNPSEEVQGAAALGQALLLRKLGDTPKIQRQRIEKIRQAVIKSADLPVLKTTVARLAESELFTIRYLSVDRTAPDIQGQDAAGEKFKLSDYRGEVVVLFFWNTWMPDAEASLKLMRDLHGKLAGKKARIIGVNQDRLATLRQMTADESSPWRNFSDSEQLIAQRYHILRYPKIFVLDQEGVIRYIGDPGAFIELSVNALL